MRLRTVLNELPLTGYQVQDPSLLGWDVVVSPADYEGRGMEGVVVLATSEQVERLGSPREGEGLVLEYLRGAASELPLRPPTGVVAASGDVAPPEFRDAFLRLVSRSGVLAVSRERLFKAFLSSYDIQQFADHASGVLRNPVLISNTDHKVLASAGDLPQGVRELRDVIASGYVTDEVASLMEADGLIRQARATRVPVVSEKGTTGVRNVSSIIYYHHLELGRLDVFEVRPLTGLDLELVDYAGALAGIMIDRLGVAGERVGMGSTVLADLLDGKLSSVDAMRALVTLLGGADGARYDLVSVVGEEGADRDYYLKAGQVMQACLEDVIWTVRDGSVVLLLTLEKDERPGFDAYDQFENLVLKNRGFCDFLERNGMDAYVCEPFEDFSLAGASLRQCTGLRQALEGRSAQGPRVHFFWHERFAVMGWSAKRDGKLAALLDKRVVAMAAYDRRRHTSYLQTAVMSVRYPGEPVVAAEALSVHRNTYFYRVNKIRELFYLDLKDGDDRLAVAFTARLLEMSEADGLTLEGRNSA